MPINFSTQETLGLGLLEKSITFEPSKHMKCTCCKKKTQVDYLVNPNIVLVEVQSFAPNPKKVSLESIQNKISFSSDYFLKAVIEFQHGDPIGHYVANVFRKDHWYCYNDVAKRCTDSNDLVVPHLLIYMPQS